MHAHPHTRTHAQRFAKHTSALTSFSPSSSDPESFPSTGHQVGQGGLAARRLMPQGAAWLTAWCKTTQETLPVTWARGAAGEKHCPTVPPKPLVICNPLTVVAAAAASLCRCRALLNRPFRGGPPWQWMGGEKKRGGKGRGGERRRHGRTKDGQKREREESLTELWLAVAS